MRESSEILLGVMAPAVDGREMGPLGDTPPAAGADHRRSAELLAGDNTIGRAGWDQAPAWGGVQAGKVAAGVVAIANGRAYNQHNPRCVCAIRMH